MGVRQSACVAAILAATVGTIPAFALIVDGTGSLGNIANVAGDSYDSVVRVGGASGVYLGNGWVITANHVGAGTVSSPNTGLSYGAVSGSEHYLYNPDTTAADITLFQISGDLSGLKTSTVSAAGVTSGTHISLVGYGNTNGSTKVYYDVTSSTSGDTTTYTWTPTTNSGAAEYAGYTYVGPGKRSGANVVGPLPSMPDVTPDANGVTGRLGNSKVFSAQFFNDPKNATGGVAFEAAVADGDSGGAVFLSDGTLVGIIDARSLYDGQPTSAVMYGSYSFAIDLANYYDQIQSIIAVPEPAGICVLSLGVAGLFMRRKRA